MQTACEEMWSGTLYRSWHWRVNIALEQIIRDAKLETKGTIYSKSFQILAYADDIDIVDRTINSVKEVCLALSKAASNMGLIINEEKTKFMQVTSKPIMC